jgi:hypothetical protein
LLLSYATLNGAPVFVDLQLSAALALLFLALLRYWNQLRRKHWCSEPHPGKGELALWPIAGVNPWLETSLDHLIDLLEQHAATCRLVAPDLYLPVFQNPRWPELARYAAVVGPLSELQRIQARFAEDVRPLGQAGASMFAVSAGSGRQGIADTAMRAWSNQ